MLDKSYEYTDFPIERHEGDVARKYGLPYAYRSYNYREQDNNFNIEVFGENYTIEVVGNGIVTAKPDQAIIYLGVVVEDKNVQNAQQKNTLISNKVIDGLKKMGIQEEEIETTSYTIRPIYDYYDGKKIFKGYEVKHMFKVTIKDTRKVGEVLDTAVQNGANVVTKVEFTVSNPEVYYEDALEKAVINAEEKARVIAKTMGVKVNEIPIRVIEKVTGIEPRYFYLPKLALNGQAPPIQEGEIKINAVVTVFFQYGTSHDN